MVPPAPVLETTAEVALPVAAPELEPGRRALWVLCEGSQRVLEDPQRVELLIEDALALGVTDLFVQVYRGGRAWYDAELADAAPYRTILATTGVDTLALLIEQAHQANLRVHAWVNVLSLSRNAGAPILTELGRDAVLVDRRGRSLLDYPKYELPQPDRTWYRMGTPGLYLDPANPGVREWVVAAFSELLTRYPGLDGLHLDYIRHPGVLPLVPGSRFGVGLDFGYGEPSRLRFEEELDLRAPRDGNMVNLSRWDAWRRDQVTEMVAAITEQARRQQPDIEMSAAVIAYADRAYLTLAQDWIRWLEESSIDFAVPMIYTLDDRLLRYQVEHFAGLPTGDRIWAGVGTWLFDHNPGRALEQLDIASRAGIADQALFSYDAIAAEGADGERPLFEGLDARMAPRPDRASETPGGP
jgi:uncharacterized lipoprotein YddW (UPF0748 family)